MKNVSSISTLVFALVANVALAQGAVLDAARLDPTLRTQLSERIQAARAQNPQAFESLARFYAQVPQLDARKRGERAPLAPALRILARESVWPLVEALVYKTPGGARLNASASSAWRAGLIEAAGSVGDPALEPLWSTVLRQPNLDASLYRAAAVALGTTNTPSAREQLLALTRAEGQRRVAVYAGLGHLRQLPAAQAIAAQLRVEKDPALAAQLIRSLSDLGSAWAWATLADRTEEQAIRAACAEALMHAFVQLDGELRQAASNALMVVDAPSTPALIAAAKGAHPSLAGELDGLAQRFEHNPTR